MIKSFIMPRFETKSIDSIINKTARKNRFNATFTIGGIGVSVVDAEIFVNDMCENLVAMIRLNWRNNKNAAGEACGTRRQKGYRIGSIRYWYSLRQYIKKQIEAIDGTFKIPRKNKKNAEQVNELREWVKTQQKMFIWKGKKYYPDPNEDCPVYSGLMLESLTAERVKIRSKNGKIPTKVNCRITVAPNRGEIAGRNNLMVIKPGSETHREISNYVNQMTGKAIAFQKYTEKEKLTLAKMAAIYNRYKNQYRQVQRIMSTAKRFL